MPAHIRTRPVRTPFAPARWVSLVLGGTVLATLAGCTSSAPEASPQTSTPAQPGSADTAAAVQAVSPVGDPVVIASGLEAPWSILRLPGSGTLISERDTALIRELLPDGSLREAGGVDSARPGGEGGLLGLAYLPADSTENGATDEAGGWVYAYFSTDTDNRIERMPLTGAPGSLTLGTPQAVLDGLPRAGNHSGGRIAFGPDGLLYATVGDAGNPALSQNLASLGGKILRMTATGDVPVGADANPFDTLVYSFGHRNPQGIAWDSDGRLWSSEFGQQTWDELNLIEAGANYGWPDVEGIADDPAFVDPVYQWTTDVASPSGIAIVQDTLFVANLRGARLLRVELGTIDPAAARTNSVDPSTVTVDEWFVNGYGRLRDVVPGPQSTLWFVSNNTDGRGTPAADDDRLYQVEVAP
ncbi:MAG: PQQ-dependent sugar dehydrogenase [Cryobacterium sp.]